MSDLRKNLRNEFEDSDYRYAYAESFLNTKIATQIKTLREQRGKKQAEIGVLIGTKQSGFSRFEDVNHSVWKTDTLWKIARALDVRVNIEFSSFGSLIDEKERFSKEQLERPTFRDDPAFRDPEIEKLVTEGELVPAGKSAHSAEVPDLSWLGNSREVASRVVATHLKQEWVNRFASLQSSATAAQSAAGGTALKELAEAKRVAGISPQATEAVVTPRQIQREAEAGNQSASDVNPFRARVRCIDNHRGPIRNRSAVKARGLNRRVRNA